MLFLTPERSFPCFCKTDPHLSDFSLDRSSLTALSKPSLTKPVLSASAGCSFSLKPWPLGHYAPGIHLYACSPLPWTVDSMRAETTSALSSRCPQDLMQRLAQNGGSAIWG